MTRFLRTAVVVLALFPASIQILALAGCSASTPSTPTDNSSVMPVGTALSGVTLSGILAGKKIYLLGSPMNPSGCWIDSQTWTGSEIFFGISSIDWTALNNGTLTYNSGCSPSPAFQTQASPGTTGNFNIYRAVVQNSTWVLTNLSLNAGQTTSVAALKLNGTQAAFVKYEKTNANGNIYLATRTGDNSFSTPTAFAQNSNSCNDDNPAFSPSGTQIVFTSSRTTASATSCASSGKTKTLWSSSYSGGAWQTPVALTGAPASATYSVDQAWLDGTNLYWTGSDCGGVSVTTCINTASLTGTAAGSSATSIAVPLPFGSWPTTSGSFVSHLGQFTISGGTAFVVCGITSFVGVSSSSGLTTLNSQSVYSGPNSSSPNYYYYHTDFKTCAIQ